MLTEKAISDFSFCPILLKEPGGKEKRVKPDRKYQDDTIDNIYQGLTTGTSNKKVFVSKVKFGNKAESFDKDIWLVVPVNDIQLLLTIHSASLLLEPSKPWQLTIERRQRRLQPEGLDQQHAEEMVRVAIIHAFKSRFNRVKCTIQTFYQELKEPITTTEPSLLKLAEAEAFFNQIQDVMTGEKVLPPNLERCEFCWWRHQCPKAQIVPEIPSSGGNTTINIL